MDRKERAIEEYKALLTELAASTNIQRPHPQSSTHLTSDVTFKRSAEILNNAENEERAKQLIVLRWEIAELEEV